MTETVQTYGDEAIIEFTSYLARLKKRCRDPVLTSADVQVFLREHFGLNGRAAARLRDHVVRVLVERGVLLFWGDRRLAQSYIAEFTLNLGPTSGLSP